MSTLSGTGASEKLRVLVVDDQELFRNLIVEALRRRGFAAAGCASAEEAIQLAYRTGFDVACLDVDLRSGVTGIDLAARLREITPSAPVVFLSAVVDPQYLRSDLATGLLGCSYLLKSSVRDVDQLVAAIDSACHGRFFIDPAVMDSAINPLGLTRHQILLLRLAAQGKTNSAIAAELGVTTGAVESGFNRIAKTLGLEASSNTNLRVECVTAYLRHALRA